MTEDHLALHARTRPDVMAVIDDRPDRPTRTLTYAELDVEVNRIANALSALGVTPGDRVAWCGPNSADVVAITHAARKVGAVAVPVGYRLSSHEMAHVLDNSDSRVVLVDADLVEPVSAAASAVACVATLAVFGDGQRASTAGVGVRLLADLTVDETPPDPALAQEHSRMMLYTSGTTGLPKGAVRRIGGEANQFGALLELLGWRDAHVVYLTTGPLYHSGPLGFALRAHLVGATVVTQAHFDPEDWLRLVQTHRVSATFAAPTPIRRVCALDPEVFGRYDVTSMRCMLANAAPWSMALKQAYLERFPVESLWEIYGSTELSICTVLEPADQLRKPGSCGRAAPGVEIALFGDDGRRVTEPGVPGELYVRSAGVFDTYHKDQQGFDADRRDGYQTVGDVAYADAEGFYYICDRKKDLIISGGANVYPAEVENVLDAHPRVHEVAVVGAPDEEWGEVVCAVVVPAGGGDVPTLAELQEYARAHLAGYKLPRRLVVVDDLPRTGSGKVLKRALRDSLEPPG